jgi:hypothetical protein
VGFFNTAHQKTPEASRNPLVMPLLIGQALPATSPKPRTLDPSRSVRVTSEIQRFGHDKELDP